MKFRMLVPAVALAGVMMTSVISAAENPQKYPDWSGLWENLSGIHFTDPRGSGPNPPPLTPEYAARYKAALDSAAHGQPVDDPTAQCVWPGMPRILISPYPSEFLFTKGRVTIIYEYMSQVRRIFTDGRAHPSADELEPSYNGDSIGHWEGDTLVVDTVGLRGDTMYENTGLPHSDQLEIRERIKLIGPDLLQDEVTAIDPKALTRPWVTKLQYRRHRDWKIEDYVCEENNRNPLDAQGHTVALGPDGKPLTGKPPK